MLPTKIESIIKIYCKFDVYFSQQREGPRKCCGSKRGPLQSFASKCFLISHPLHLYGGVTRHRITQTRVKRMPIFFIRWSNRQSAGKSINFNASGAIVNRTVKRTKRMGNEQASHAYSTKRMKHEWVIHWTYIKRQKHLMRRASPSDFF